MPEYIPRPQLPYGMAEELARMAQQRAMIIPNALNQGIQAALQQIGPALLQRAQLPNWQEAQQVYPDLQIPMQTIPGAVAKQYYNVPGPAAPGPRPAPRVETGPAQVPSTEKLTPFQAAAVQQAGGQQVALERALTLERTKEAGRAEAATAKEEAKARVDILPVNDIDRLNFKIAYGKDMPEDMTSWHRAQQKEVAGMAQQKLKPPPAGSQPLVKGSREETKFLQAGWEKIMRFGDPYVAMRGSALGTAGLLNSRADRALQILKDSKITPQRKAMVVVDIAGIMHQGSPDEIEIKTQNYGTLLDRMAYYKQYLTNEPVAVDQPEIQEELLKIIREIKEVDNNIITKNLRMLEIAEDEVIKRTPQRWEEFKVAVFDTTRAPLPKELYGEDKKLKNDDSGGNKSDVDNLLIEFKQ